MVLEFDALQELVLGFYWHPALQKIRVNSRSFAVKSNEHLPNVGALAGLRSFCCRQRPGKDILAPPDGRVAQR